MILEEIYSLEIKTFNLEDLFILERLPNYITCTTSSSLTNFFHGLPFYSRSQFDQLARLREIFTSQLAMAEVTPSFRLGDTNSVYSEPAYRFNAGPGSVCSEPAYRPPSPRCRDCRQSMTMSRTPSQSSLPSLTGIVAIAGMEQYASLRHPDGASDPNLPKLEKTTDDMLDPDDGPHTHIRENPLAELLHCQSEDDDGQLKGPSSTLLPPQNLPTLPLLPLSTPMD